MAVIGQGGMGVVYKAHDPLIDRMVAVKVVRTQGLDPQLRDEYLDRFRLEAKAAGRCMHPAIVAVYDFSSADDEPYIVMEFVEGRTLQQIFRVREDRRRLAIDAIFQQILSGLAYAHSLGVTHRDIKPANVIITQAGQVKIADFGIARLADGLATKAGCMLGTPSYMAPEQVRGVEVDHRADVFAVGAMLYEALAGGPPFAGSNLAETLQRLTGPDAASMIVVETVGAGAYIPLLKQALAKQPERRFQSAEAFATALRSVAVAGASPELADATVLQRVPASQVPAAKRNWDTTMLQRVERALAKHVGPIARVVVARAARESATKEELYEALASSLQSTADRTAFLRTLGGSRLEPTLGSERAGGGGTYSGSGSLAQSVTIGGSTVSAEAMTAAQTVLASYVGPIARVLARQAASASASPQDFIERLCAHVAKPEDTAVLRRRLRAKMEAGLR
jgi:tRNA A-37 threonylcarbamoyl transferase component Bud32